ncbi:nitroreductase [Caldicoprobacter guelmensis]|uniref:nitroreductase family protein n=1 Tax=Caldicoprobacter guelmensis TaxID=1170224 RepID=UPI00195A0501|nr:nitroreductase family protein [Caldicoprobacter guelmensis]MBM7581644.1 nitroreductase [Caldicoprobacter guelmensis]
MEFMEVISKRRAIRKYKKDPIPDVILQKLFYTLSLAPSGNNRQPYKFLFIKDEKLRREIVQRACHQEFLYDAPVIMVACCEPGRSFDTAIAVDHLVLAATNEGLGTCWVGWFERDVVKEILGIEPHMEVPILIPIGYPDESPSARPRKSLDELIEVI